MAPTSLISSAGETAAAEAPLGARRLGPLARPFVAWVRGAEGKVGEESPEAGTDSSFLCPSTGLGGPRERRPANAGLIRPASFPLAAETCVEGMLAVSEPTDDRKLRIERISSFGSSLSVSTTSLRSMSRLGLNLGFMSGNSCSRATGDATSSKARGDTGASCARKDRLGLSSEAVGL